MSTFTLILLLLALAALFVIPAILGSRSQKAQDSNLAQSQSLAIGQVEHITRSDDLIVRFNFELPGGKTIQRASGVLPLSSKAAPGMKIMVRYNPKLPAVCRLEPDLPVPENETPGSGRA